MALDFLGNIGNAATSFANIAGPLGSILEAVRGKNTDQQDLRQQIIDMSTNMPQSEAERQAIALRMALADPNNSLVKALTEQETRSGMEGLQSEIRSKVLADRREGAMGRSPVFFDPERADENIAFQVSRGAPGIRAAAGQSALERILAASGVGQFASNQDQRYQGNLNALASLYAMNEKNPQQDSMTKNVNRLQQGVGGLQQILDIFGKGKKASGQMGPFPMNERLQGGETIRWNQMRY